MRVGLVQLCSSTNVSENIKTASEFIRQAAAQRAELVATPEMTHLLQKDKAGLFASIRSEEDDLGVVAFAALAKELGIHILIGSLAIKIGDKVANRSFLFGKDGGILARYDKIHLFDAQVSDTESYKESATYEAGQSSITTRVEDATLGLSICYDLRFAALYRQYAQLGAQILSVPAAFTVPTGQAHWDVLLRARAIETGSFVIAPAQGGHHDDGRLTYGYSKIINPWGGVIAELAHDRPGILCTNIDLSEVDKMRRRIPSWGDARSWYHNVV